MNVARLFGWDLEPITSAPRVYLSGPITGITWPEAQRWRVEASASLAARGVVAFSPLRGLDRLEELLSDHRLIPPMRGIFAEFPELALDGASPETLAARDVEDVLNADAVLVNLLPGAARRALQPLTWRLSLGTMIEAGIACGRGLASVVVAARPGDLHAGYEMFRACVTVWHEVEDEGDLVPDRIIDEVAGMAAQIA